ncbi:uncharacterized protein LACBIDRAFT_335923 [Laccaria bicolor S238N-H82]|uniref:Predicted protein n=1 Tax=Laccaria bicolor (strain S238N-H82 / ATCC MYA-4686) TaxID=486041 RepID=B0E3U8_LACBS|nr:uncharacterized protein LACBIDRAFT_335923 [Laccaria bicolor S238N-H82]EDQ98480.1 predicted protein [Laccaria bicolor S238N-H82]|eukprot:XP_001890865.1 predicted protein [Laccaria bicolor S238N-H82]
MGLRVGTMDDLITDSVQIMIGLTSDAITVVERTPGTAIPPGVNRAGDVTWELRQLLKRPHLSTFASIFDGIREGSITASRVARNPGVESGVTGCKMVQDYRSKSVLQGFSQVGRFMDLPNGDMSELGLVQICFTVESCYDRSTHTHLGLFPTHSTPFVTPSMPAKSRLCLPGHFIVFTFCIPSTFKSEPSFNDAGSALHLSSTAHKWLTFLHISLTFETLLGSSMPTISAKSRKRARSWFKKGQTLQVPADCAARAAGPDSVKEVDVVCTVRTRVILARSTGIGWLSETKGLSNDTPSSVVQSRGVRSVDLRRVIWPRELDTGNFRGSDHQQ